MNIRQAIHRLPILFGLLLVWTHASAVITIPIDEGVERGVPIALVPFGGESSGEIEFAIEDVVRDDLSRTGRFDPIPREEHISSPTTKDEILFSDWQLISADYVLIGRVEPNPEGGDSFRVIARLYDAFEQKQVFGIQFIASPNQIRATAHRIANAVFENVTEEMSSFNTQIVYTATVPSDDGGAPEHVLYIADYDGFNPQIVLRGSRPILSPAWSPDFTQIAYAELGLSDASIYIQTVADGERFAITTPAGYSSAPNWSPDGQRISFTNSSDGNYDIYIYSLNDGSLTRVTSHRLIDTEPSWSPDGRSIVFTSNRGKDPQIYEARARRNASARRLPLEGRSNTGASYSPGGDKLAVITDQGSGNQVGVYDLSADEMRIVSSTSLDDSVKFSPYGDMLIHVVEGRERYIKILSPDGRVQSRIPVAEGQVKQVDWGSF